MINFPFLLLIWIYLNRRRKTRRFTVQRPNAKVMLQNTISNLHLCRQLLRVSPNTLNDLTNMMRNINVDFITKREVIMIGLHFLGINPTIREQCALFGLSNIVIVRARKEFVNSVVETFSYLFEPRHWNLNTILDHDSDYIRSGRFSGAIVAVDGTHIPVRVLEDEKEKFRNRKGYISTNVLIMCDFRMNILFCCAGAEGSAHDSFVMNNSGILNILNAFPSNNYFLGDAGYGLSARILTPYRGVRYHLSEYTARNAPVNSRELYNLRHSGCRNVVERVIGLLKRRWCILRKTNESMDKILINKSIMACCLLNNYLMSFDDMILPEEPSIIENDIENRGTYTGMQNNTVEDSMSSRIWRDEISSRMWNEYIL